MENVNTTAQDVHLLNLPRELFHNIISRLPCRDVCSLARVCRVLKEACYDDVLWRMFCEAEYSLVDKQQWEASSYKDLYGRLFSHYNLLGLWYGDNDPYGSLYLAKMINGVFHFFDITGYEGKQNRYCFFIHSNIKDLLYDRNLTQSLCSTEDPPHVFRRFHIYDAVELEKTSRSDKLTLKLPHAKVTLTKLAWEQAVPREPHTVLGLFTGSYGAHGVEIILVTEGPGRLEARKITGDPFVPCGQVTWRADLGNVVDVEEGDPHRIFRGFGQAANRGFQSPTFEDGFLRLHAGSQDWLQFGWLPFGFLISYSRLRITPDDYV
eukprot:Colp12_sorted_trinity150504_noHs@26884